VKCRMEVEPHALEGECRRGVELVFELCDKDEVFLECRSVYCEVNEVLKRTRSISRMAEHSAWLITPCSSSEYCSTNAWIAV
jgi:hypothetical protein